ncbi:unnamed protein product [Choristocarpus tenellus]
MSLAFLFKKTWHTSTLQNQEKVWIAEQKDAAEKQRIAELTKQVEEERQVRELEEMQAAGGHAAERKERIDWMYEGPMQSSQDRQAEANEYLLGKEFKLEDKGASEIKKLEETQAPGTLFTAVSQTTSANEAFRRVQEDPLLKMRRAKIEAQNSVVNNPVKMSRIRHQLEAELAERAEQKRARKEAKKAKKGERKQEKKEKKKERKKSYRTNNMDKRDERDEMDERGRRFHTKGSSEVKDRRICGERQNHRRDRDNNVPQGVRDRTRTEQEESRDGRDTTSTRKRHRSQERERGSHRDRHSGRDLDRHEREHRNRDTRDATIGGRKRSRECDRGEVNGKQRVQDRQNLEGYVHEITRGIASTEEGIRGEKHPHGSSSDPELKRSGKYGLISGAKVSRGGDLGPAAALLAGKEREREARERERAEARRRRVMTTEEREMRLAQMESDGMRNQELKKQRLEHGQQVDMHLKATDRAGTQGKSAAFIKDMRHEAMGEMGLEERMQRNRHYQQRGADVHNFMSRG